MLHATIPILHYSNISLLQRELINKKNPKKIKIRYINKSGKIRGRRKLGITEGFFYLQCKTKRGNTV